MYVIKNGLVLENGAGFYKKDVLIQDGQIKKIEENITHSAQSNCKVLDAQGCWVVPGLIDIHTHGAIGIDFMEAGYLELIKLSMFYASKGVTSFIPTTMTDSADKINNALDNIRHAIEKGLPGARIAGINMEGPFINNDYRGAHPQKYIVAPTLELVKHFIKRSGNNIRLMTIAPELKGVKEIAQELLAEGITVSAGHSGVDFINAEIAFNSGFGHVTHLFNAMTGMHHRSPGLVGAALDNGNVTVEIIPDCIHVHPAVAKAAMKCKTFDRVVLITDSIVATGLDPNHPNMEFAGKQITVRGGRAVFESGVLAGSTITLIDGVKNTVQRMGVNLEDAIKMASENPAKVIGVFDKRGSISEGKDADVVILNKALEVCTTITNGTIAFRRSEGTLH